MVEEEDGAQDGQRAAQEGGAPAQALSPPGCVCLAAAWPLLEANVQTLHVALARTARAMHQGQSEMQSRQRGTA